jgi:hypothetical protein
LSIWWLPVVVVGAGRVRRVRAVVVVRVVCWQVLRLLRLSLMR